MLALIYIAFISLGLPDAAWLGWPVMHAELGVPVSYMGIISMIISRWDGCIEPVFGQNDPKIWNQNRNGCQRISDRYCTVWIFFFFAVLDAGRFAVPYGLGAGAIDSALNNYVALHYKAKHMSWLHCFWGVGNCQSVYHGLCADEPDVEQRLSHYWIFAAGHCHSFTFDAAGLEYQQIGNGNRWKECRTGGCTENKGRSLSPDWLFCVLCTGGNSNAVGEHLLCRGKGISTERAATFAALFYIGITSGRFASGFITDKLGDQKMIRLGTGIFNLRYPGAVSSDCVLSGGVCGIPL